MCTLTSECQVFHSGKFLFFLCKWKQFNATENPTLRKLCKAPHTTDMSILDVLVCVGVKFVFQWRQRQHKKGGTSLLIFLLSTHKWLREHKMPWPDCWTLTALGVHHRSILHLRPVYLTRSELQWPAQAEWKVKSLPLGWTRSFKRFHHSTWGKLEQNDVKEQHPRTLFCVAEQETGIYSEPKFLLTNANSNNPPNQTGQTIQMSPLLLRGSVGPSLHILGVHPHQRAKQIWYNGRTTEQFTKVQKYKETATIATAFSALIFQFVYEQVSFFGWWFLSQLHCGCPCWPHRNMEVTGMPHAFGLFLLFTAKL